MEERHVQNLLSKLPTGGDGWTAVTNIQVLFFRLTIDAATDFLFGESLLSQLTEAQQSPAERQASFATNFDSAQSHMAQAFRLGDLHWLYRSADYARNRQRVNDFVQRYVDVALQRRQAAKSAPIDEKQEPERYVFLNTLAQQTQDPIELRSQILNVLVAGRDTTASLLSWTMLELLRHPEVFTKLRHTILEAFGPYTAEPTSTISFASLKSCQYLQYVLSEALRMWAVVPGNVRRSNKNTTLPRGGGPDGLSPIFIPAHTTVEYSVHVMHHRKDLWGEDADEFRPERFAGRKSGWEYLPFNGGPRICIGQQFALTEASYVLVRLLQRFDQIAVVQGPEVPKDPRAFLTLTMSPKDQVTLRLHQARKGGEWTCFSALKLARF
ncbi:hypothetical protein MRB53_041547 [Persea americana]|nr:hypothetical protein MRB53_041547 [Persea americana]